ncbi:RnfH family protein [Halopseudomonas yangmingensis]|uniref:UPF0125 protein SAMN05216217_11525 n=1 Tax=Halopseudomonas yangmingensis TaxID=1720063 RepID=A0A1I4TMY6_9GAMM|nr:hypothetical protein SAMN05216217_11525 [Halopseudomonas yangmingensis]
MVAEHSIVVEVAYALPDKQRIIAVAVPQGTSMLEAARLSGIVNEFPGLDLDASSMGIFGKSVAKPAERVLQAGERVEIYRPLLADPKEVRKQRAARAKAEEQAG